MFRKTKTGIPINLHRWDFTEEGFVRRDSEAADEEARFKLRVQEDARNRLLSRIGGGKALRWFKVNGYMYR